MRDLFVLSQEAESILKNSALLIDTNVLFDAWLFSDAFAALRAKFTDLDCYLFTTRSVVIEFLGGTQDEDSLKTKIAFIEVIFGRKLEQLFLPLEPMFPKPDLFLSFNRHIKNFSSTDFALYCALRKYHKSNLILMTRNHKDFGQPDIERIGFITLLGRKEVHTHGLYKAV